MTRRQSVHQFHSGTASGDAVTQTMFEFQRYLRALGFASEIFAEHVAPDLRDVICAIDDYRGGDDNVLLVHHSMGHGAFDRILTLPDRIVTVYHNITPAQYLSDDGNRRHAAIGREQLRMLAARSECGIAVSNFNRREMLDAGFTEVDVVPARTDFSDYKPDGVVRWRTNDWLFVGRVMENKCQHDVVRAFAAYARSYDARARLLLVGDTANRSYVDQIRALAEDLGVADRVELKGKLLQTDLLTCYRECGVLVCLSEHEGFGVPLLEAMAAGLPVVAYTSAAVPETLGGAAILLDDKDPWLVAGTVKVLFDDPDLRHRLVHRQYERVTKVESIDAPNILKRVISTARGEPRRRTTQIQGPFETSYSLAVLNRHLALALAEEPQLDVSIYATEGPGDYVPRPADLERHPAAAKLFAKCQSTPYPDVVIRQMYPPRVADSPGGLTFQYFGWEESRLPDSYVSSFNRHLDGIGVMSHFVAQLLRDSGVTVPISVVGVGLESHASTLPPRHAALRDLRAFRFLNIGSAFPRKGVDVLLRAYFERFDGDDDVSLILKSFPNPHNVVGELLAALKRTTTNPPDVRWIDEDLPEQQVRRLYNVASCYVHPARGEGFGLPVAEAMLARVPVIATAYGGLADFCSDETVLTVPFTIETSRTHLSVPGSQWAEPDRTALGDRLREIVSHLNDSSIQERVQRAAELITERYTWRAVAGHWNEFIQSVERTRRIPRVAMVSTWNSRCGIAENTRYLTGHLRQKVDVEIYANSGAELLDPTADRGVVRCWEDRWAPDLSALRDCLARSSADVVHFQFNFGFFELGRLAELIELELHNRPVVVTLHRTRDVEIDNELVSLAQIGPTLEKVDRVIVHQARDAETLSDLGISARVEVIPIGTPSTSLPPRSELRERLGFRMRPVISTFGFLLPHKGTLELIRAVDLLRRTLPDVLLVAVCSIHPDLSSTQYHDVCVAEITRLGLEESVVLVTDFLPESEAQALLAATDLIVLPYKETEESQSAALRFVLPLGRPIMAPDIAIFADAREALTLIADASPAGLARAIGGLVTDPDALEQRAEQAAQFARRISWTSIAGRYQRLYAEMSASVPR